MTTVLEIELFGNCNLRCVMCAQQFPDRRQKAITFNEFTDIFGLYSDDKIDYITLHGSGEVLLSPIFVDVLRFIPLGIPIRFLTNGTQIYKHADSLKFFADKIDAIDISIDACTHEIYKKIRGGDFESTLSSIRSISLDHLFNSKLRLNFTYHKHNYQDIPLLATLANNLGIQRVALWPLVESAPYISKKWEVKFNDPNALSLFNYSQSIMHPDDPALLGNLSQLEEAALASNVDVLFPDFYNFKDSEPLKPSDCPVVNYNRIYYSSGESKHCCLQTRPVFNWITDGIMKFESAPRHSKIISELNQNKVPFECEHSGCPYISNFPHLEATLPSSVSFSHRG